MSARTRTKILLHDQKRVRAEYCEEIFKIGWAVRSVQGWGMSTWQRFSGIFLPKGVFQQKKKDLSLFSQRALHHPLHHNHNHFLLLLFLCSFFSFCHKKWTFKKRIEKSFHFLFLFIDTEFIFFQSFWKLLVLFFFYSFALSTCMNCKAEEETKQNG